MKESLLRYFRHDSDTFSDNLTRRTMIQHTWNQHGDYEYEVCPGCGCDPEDEHEEHCEVYLEKMRERAEMMSDLAEDR